MTRKTHKVSGWTRTYCGDGSSNWIITPTDNSGIRKVAFMSSGSWANLPNDDGANINQPRVVMVDGPPLPQWAMEWLDKANTKACWRSKAAFQSALDQADFDADMRDANAY